MKRQDEEVEGEWAQHSVLSIIKETYPVGPVHYPWARRHEMRRPVLMQPLWLLCLLPENNQESSRGAKRIKEEFTTLGVLQVNSRSRSVTTTTFSGAMYCSS